MLKRHFICLIILLCLAFSSGCFTAEIHSKVNSDGTLGSYSVGITTSQFVYGMLTSQAKEDGYSNLGESLMKDAEPGSYSYNEKWDGDTVEITISTTQTMQSTDPELWKIQVENGYMVYNDKRLVSDDITGDSNEFADAMLNSVAVHYYLEMPGKIVESNANVVDGNKAEWHLTGANAFNTDIYAKSELPVFGLPGFGLIITLIGLISAIILVSRRGI